jgi:hypothetical protein
VQRCGVLFFSTLTAPQASIRHQAIMIHERDKENPEASTKNLFF